jgi:hypothetical protein
MKYQPGFTDFFMSPVTGRIILPMMPDIPQNYIWIGNRNDRPLPSPIIIDLRLEIIDIRCRLSETRFILQAASPDFDQSQALNELIDGILKHESGVVSIALPWIDYLPVELPYRNIWIGNEFDQPEPYPRIFLENLPSMLSADPTLLFGAYNLYSGSPNPLTLGEPEIVKTLHITNMADLPVGHLWLGQISADPLNLGLNRPVPIIVLPLANMADLPEGKIWRGDITDRPVPSDDLTNLEEDVLEIEINIDSIFDHLAEIDIHLGDIDIHLGDIDTQLGDINIHLGDIDTHLGDIDIHLGDIDVQLGDINLSIDSIFDTLASIQADITAIFEAITNINIQLGDLVLRLDGIDIDLGEIGIRLDGIDLEIETNLASGLDHLADLQLQIDAGISSGMDHLAIINAALDAINVSITDIYASITTINTTIIDIQTDITTIYATIVDIQTDITTIQTDITTINSSIVDILAAIVIIEDSIGDGSVTLTGDVTGSGQVGDSIVTTLTVPLNLIPTPTGDLDLGFYKITSLLDPFFPQDATNKSYVDSGFSYLAGITLNNVPIATGTVNLNNQSLNNVNAIILAGSIRSINFEGAVAAGLTSYMAFPDSSQVRRIILWNDPLAPNDFEFSGFGTDSAASILYHANINASHLFYAGLTSTTKFLIADFSATSADFSTPVSINIGSSTSVPLLFNAAVNRCKIALYQTTGNSFQVYGLGVIGSTLVYSVDSTSSSHVFFAGTSSTTADEIFRIKGTGWASVSGGDGTFYSRVPSAHVQMTANATTTSCTTNVWIKAAGTTTATAGTVQCTTATTNRITFTGSDLSAACVGMASASASVAVTNLAATRVAIAIYKNGTLIQNAPVYGTTNIAGSVNSPTALTIPPIMVSLSPTDYIEVWVLAGNNTVMTVTNMNLSFSAT